MTFRMVMNTWKERKAMLWADPTQELSAANLWHDKVPWSLQTSHSPLPGGYAG